MGDNTIIDVVRKAGFVVEPVVDTDHLDDWTSSSSSEEVNNGIDISDQ